MSSVCMFLCMCVCAIFMHLFEHFHSAFSSECDKRQPEEARVQQGLNNLFDVSFLTL